MLDYAKSGSLACRRQGGASGDWQVMAESCEFAIMPVTSHPQTAYLPRSAFGEKRQPLFTTVRQL
jgi:hypothetical protein